MKISYKSLIIIGSGPAAYTASIYAGRAKIEHFIITGEIKGGQLITSLDVENFPGFPIISGLELMQKLEEHSKLFGGILVNDTITDINSEERPFILTGNKSNYKAKTIIICTGSSPRKLYLPNEDKLLGKGVSYCATCDGNFYKNEVLAVVGGGNNAVEEAIYLSNIAKHVYLIHRRDTLRAEKILQEKLINNSKITIIWNHVVRELLYNKIGLTGIKISNTKNFAEKTLEISGIFIAVGHIPNTKFLKNSIDLDENGYIITKNKTTETSIPGIFAAGDVQDPIYRQAITSAASGAMAAINLNLYLMKNP